GFGRRSAQSIWPGSNTGISAVETPLRRQETPWQGRRIGPICLLPSGRRRMMEIGNSKGNGAVTGEVRTLLRIEGLALFCAATLFYWISGASWWLFAVLLLAPDLSFLAYLAGPRLGAAGYNALHATIGPLLPALASMV